MRELDVLIVGSGPAGMSTALHLIRLDPSWSKRMVVVDSAVHPRKKLCGGGVTHLGSGILANLGLAFEPEHVAVQEIRILFEKDALRIRERKPLRITRRDEFDHWLVQRGVERGVEVRQGEAVTDVVQAADFVDVSTARETYRTRVLVAADGSSSFVKRRLKWGGRPQKARLLEVLTPEVAEDRVEFRDGVAVFDFTAMKSGVQGYCWDFPSLIDGSPHMNRGVFDSRVRPELPRAHLPETLAGHLEHQGLELSDCELEGHPIHWFDAAADLSKPHVLLAGDAAGVDPMFGEGISFALGYGEVAAAEIDDGYRRGDYSFENYKRNVLAHPLLRRLRWRGLSARFLYALPKHPRMARLLWRTADLISRALFRLPPVAPRAGLPRSTHDPSQAPDRSRSAIDAAG